MFFESLRYMLRNVTTWYRKKFFLCLLRAPALIALPAVTALIPKLMMDSIQSQIDAMHMIGIIAAMSALVALLSWVDPFLRHKSVGTANNMQARYRIMAFQKLLHTDYYNLETYEGRRKYERSFPFIGADADGISSWGFINVSVLLLTNFLGIFTYLILLIKLDPLLLFIILLTCLFEYLLAHRLGQRKMEFTNDESSIRMRFNYFYRTASDAQYGKDVRLYNMKDWFLKLFAVATAEHAKILGLFTRQSLHITALQSILAFIREIAAYVFLITSVLAEKITISDFVFFFGIVTGFSAWITGLSRQVVEMHQICAECQKFRDFIDMPEKSDSGKMPFKEAVSEIRFQNVCFSYNSGDEPALKQINLAIRQGERIAIVGENGAGKTTLIKLLCGLYAPTSGEIFINDINSQKIAQKDLFRLFGVVFQDYHFLPMTIAENITLCPAGNEDSEKLHNALIEADMLAKIEDLPQGLNTPMVKQVRENAVEFSGGQAQRLLLARSLYKDAPVLILDEPTAALDPIAERNIYERYNRLMQAKTSFFISHRLASTQFCDRILYLSGGEITEEGSHEELLALQGDYWRMFQAQSYYYKRAEVTV